MRAARNRLAMSSAPVTSRNAFSSRATPRSSSTCDEIRRQAVARRRRLQHDLRALMDDAVGGPEHAGAERLHHEFQHRCDKPVRQVGQDFGDAVLDGPEAARHAPFQRAKSGRLPALVLPAFQRGGQQIQFGQDVAEAGRQHLLALQRAAKRQQRHVGAERESRRIARELAIEPRRIAGVGRRRKRRHRSSCGPRRGTAWRCCDRYVSRTLCRRRPTL